MNIARRSLNIVTAFLKSYGPSNIKKRLWDKEFSGSKWDFIDETVGDCVYPPLERHLRNGSILDLGCGPGNTANELGIDAYQSYVGVDISEAALDKARIRSEKCGRAEKNRFVCDDFINYAPTEQFDVILFRESLYHVPPNKIKPVLDRYSSYLKEEGIFVVRLCTSKDGKDVRRPKAMIGIIKAGFDVLEINQYEESGATVVVFRQPSKVSTSRGQASTQP